ncbi:hypothetical protein like AT1G16850 [Hibiscus trionum]|nr:hypothetical protein like AT1G16850 [Hibiscus trionum]
MRKSRARALTWLIILFLFLSHQIVCQDEEKPSMFQLLANTISSLKKPHRSYWEKTKAVIHEFQLHFTPPRLDFRGTGAADGAGEKVKAAVKDMIGTSEAVAEETAKSAAQAVHKTAEKLKGTASVSSKQESRPDL